MEQIFPPHFIILTQKEFFYEDKEIFDHGTGPLDVQLVDEQTLNKLRDVSPKN